MEENKFKIYSEDNSLYIISNSKTYSLNKTSKAFTEINDYNPSPDAKEFNIYSILGNIKAINNNYMICALEVINIGKILEANIYKIKKFTYIPMQGNEINKEDVKYLKMLDDFLSRNNLYFSNKLDLTISLINFNSIKENKNINNIDNRNSFIFKNSIIKYCWNYSIGKYFDIDGMSDFVFPVINGFIDIKNETEDYSDEFQFILIGRKDTRRSGVRLLIRGSDNEGNIANSCESEEIVIYHPNNKDEIHIASFVQVRGSIPLMWTQEPSLQLNPQIRPRNDFDVNATVFKIHLDELMNIYNSICCINLVDQKKDQKIIGDYYSNLIQNYREKNKNISNKIDFAWFDFHAECKKLKYENIKKLFKKNSVHKCLNSYGYTHILIKSNILEAVQNNEKIFDYLLNNEQNFKFIQLQKGAFRTNCIDSLDRTNVVQSTFARYFLFKILYELKLSHKQPSEDDVFQKFQGGFENIFKIIWADHGDGISKPYSGTGAMKSDFVRTGKRTYKGNLQDGVISLTRFYINNFRDGYYQDCNDYFLGKLNPKFDKFKNHSLLNIKIIMVIAIFLCNYVYSILSRLALPSDDIFSVGKMIYKGILYFIIYIFILVLFSTLSLNNFIDLHSKHE